MTATLLVMQLYLYTLTPYWFYKKMEKDSASERLHSGLLMESVHGGVSALHNIKMIILVWPKPDF